MADKAKVVTDVEKPGSTPAGATSRPLIISKSPAVKDPMVSEDPETLPEPDRMPPSAVKKTIAPLSAPEKEAEKQLVKPTEDRAPRSAEPESKEVPKEAALSPEMPTDQSAEEIAAAQQAVLSKEEQDQAELVTKLVEQKKYFVPVGAVQKRRTARNTALLALVLLTLVGAALAIDAEVIKTDITLPFDLIKTASK